MLILEDRLAAGRLGVPEHALRREAEDDVVGREFVAIMELYALAQLQLERFVVNALPFRRKAGNRTLIAHPVAQDQAFPEVGEEHTLADIRLLVPDVERVVDGDLLHGDGDGWARALTHGEARQDHAARSCADEPQRAAPVDEKHENLL